MEINSGFILILALLLPRMNELGASNNPWRPWRYDEAWIQFRRSTGLVYRDEKEEITRYKIFKNNLKKIKEHNELYERKRVPYDMKMNKFGDLTREEFQILIFGVTPLLPRPLGSSFQSFSSLTTAPYSLDLRTRGMITPVKDQGYCASGAIFSAIGALEGALYRNTNQLEPLSEQHVLDCMVDQSCMGAYFNKAIIHLATEGARAERDYPFRGRKGKCEENETRTEIKFTGIRHVIPGDTIALEAVLHRVGPVSVQMIASSRLQFYNSGIFDDFGFDISKKFAALVIGYGTDPYWGSEYWLVKNNWGENWGESGYLKIAKYQGDPLITGTLQFPDF